MVATRRNSRGLPPLGPRGKEAERTGSKTADSKEVFILSSKTQTRTRNTIASEGKKKEVSSLSYGRKEAPKIAEVSDDGGSGAGYRRETGGHFLQGLKLECCADVLSIPDPPSPGKVPARRFSSPVVHPLRNISNASDTEEEGSENVTSRRKSRTKRKSMPSFQPSHSCASALCDDVATPLAHDPLEETKQDSRKRRKKRQSIILPSDLDSTDGNADEYTKTYATFRNDPSPPATPARETKTPSKPLTTSLYDIRQIIHEYTLVPRSERAASAALKELFDRTEYPLRSAQAGCDSVGYAVPDFDPSTMSREHKIAFFTKIGPELQRMDACKVSDAKMVAEVTQCKPQKVRGGFYRYIHSVTGRPVSPEEFEERYLMMLEEVNHIRSHAWKEYFCKLREESSQGNEEYSPVKDTPCRERLMQSQTRHDPQPKEPQDDDDEDSASEDEDDQFLLPLPSRGKTSSDPAIARAERKLWNAIDEALAEYSREVLAARVAAPQTPVQC